MQYRIVIFSRSIRTVCVDVKCNKCPQQIELPIWNKNCLLRRFCKMFGLGLKRKMYWGRNREKNVYCFEKEYYSNHVFSILRLRFKLICTNVLVYLEPWLLPAGSSWPWSWFIVSRHYIIFEETFTTRRVNRSFPRSLPQDPVSTDAIPNKTMHSS